MYLNKLYMNVCIQIIKRRQNYVKSLFLLYFMKRKINRELTAGGGVT